MSTNKLVQARTYIIKRQELTNRLKQVLIECLSLDREVDEIPDDCMLFGIGLGLDSVDVLEIVVAVENDFKIRIEDDSMQEIRSVNSIVDLILSHQISQER